MTEKKVEILTKENEPKARLTHVAALAKGNISFLRTRKNLDDDLVKEAINHLEIALENLDKARVLFK